jgi:hypothetical protein
MLRHILERDTGWTTWPVRACQFLFTNYFYEGSTGKFFENSGFEWILVRLTGFGHIGIFRSG